MLHGAVFSKSAPWPPEAKVIVNPGNIEKFTNNA
jgi:hypothetical protein